MSNPTRYLDGNRTRIDVADEISSYYATQAITQAQARLQNGNVPVIDEDHVKEAKDFVDNLHL